MANRWGVMEKKEMKEGKVFTWPRARPEIQITKNDDKGGTILCRGEKALVKSRRNLKGKRGVLPMVKSKQRNGAALWGAGGVT